MTSHESLEAPSAAQPPTILVVDDSPAKRLAVRAMLGPLGHTIVEADSGRAALRAVMQQTFAIILMDVRMPTMDGYETANLIRERSQTRLTPIIFVTASVRSSPMATATAYAAGAIDFIFTPIVPEVLRAKVSAFVDLFTQSEELRRSLQSITSLNAALRDSELRAQAVLQNVADGIVTADETGRIESFNASARRLFGYSEEEVIGQPLRLLMASDRRSDPTEPTQAVGRRKDGSCFPMDVETSEIQIGDRTLTIGCIRDMSERKAHIEALGHQALHDALTGLPNRTLLGDRMERAIASAERAGEPRAVLIMDLDDFKQVNDTLGHDQGDALLTELGKRLLASVRDTDTVARLGGDEFAILLDSETDLTAAATAAWKIQQACEPAFVIDDEAFCVSASIGIALYPEHGTTTADLLRRADLAMYDAKRTGSGYAVFEAAQEKQTARQLALLGDLRQCIARDELVVHYQPVIDLVTRRTFGVEALVRWRHPRHGLLLPGSFVPEVERTALIAPVTRWVLNETLRQQRVWRDQGLDVTVAVNISARTLRRAGDLPDTVAELTERWGTPPGRLTLELTEGALIEAAAPEVLARLHDLGVTVSIDDFGTGYSSLAYLQKLPIDQIKIDRCFVTNLASIPGDAVIVRSTIELAHNLDLTVVAEGIEDEVALERLHEYGCDSAQGYFFSPACAADELTAWLAEEPFGAHAGTSVHQ